MKKNYVKKCLALTLAFSMTFSTVAFADTAKDTYTNEQGSGENGTIEPGATTPGTTEPGTTTPGTTEPGTTEPGTTEPGTTEPGTTEPGTTTPGESEPENPVKHYGWYTDEETGKTYYYDLEGNIKTGWQTRDGIKYYLDGEDEEYPGAMVTDAVKEIDGKYYSFNAEGRLQKGWAFHVEGWYYADPTDGVLQTGWKKLGSVWYYLDGENEEYPCLMVQNDWKKVKNIWYYFDNNGAMVTGWQQVDNTWYYLNSDGSMAKGWIKVKNAWYYLNNSGVMATGWQKINGKWYYLKSSGAMATGWQKVDGSWYYLNSNGSMATGWLKVSGKWYYLKSNGAMVTGWQKIGSSWYYLNGSGAMATGWAKLGGKWYYLKSNGAMVTGWQKINGYWYYFYKNKDSHGGIEGVMAANTKIDGYTLSASGAMKPTANSQMALKAQAYSSSTGYLILVNRATCQVGIFTGKTGFWNQIKSWSCSPGASSSPTVAGTFRVGGKGYYFDSGSARCYWYTQFYGNYLFHSVLYNKNGTLMDGRLGMHLSHGCVRLQIDNAKWIYNNIPRGTTVVVY